MPFELSDFVGQPCNSRMAYEFLPRGKHELGLERVAESLRRAGVYIEIETPYLLMLKAGGRDVSLFRSGKIIVKSTRSEQEATEIASRLVGCLE